jgi:hypothetical protein
MGRRRSDVYVTEQPEGRSTVSPGMHARVRFVLG